MVLSRSAINLVIDGLAKPMPRFSTALFNLTAAFSSSAKALINVLLNFNAAPAARLTPKVLPRLFTFFSNLFLDSKLKPNSGRLTL